MKVEIGVEITVVIIKTIYEQSRNIHPGLIPDLVYFNIAEMLKDEDMACFEQWVTEKLEIAPKEAFSDVRIKDCKDNGFYCETTINDMTFLAMGDYIDVS